MVLDAALLNTQGLRSPLHLGVVAIEIGAFGSPLTKVANFIYIWFLKKLSYFMSDPENPFTISKTSDFAIFNFPKREYV